MWEENVIPHNVRFASRYVRDYAPEGRYDSEDFSIEVYPPASNCSEYLINSPVSTGARNWANAERMDCRANRGLPQSINSTLPDLA